MSFIFKNHDQILKIPFKKSHITKINTENTQRNLIFSDSTKRKNIILLLYKRAWTSTTRFSQHFLLREHDATQKQHRKPLISKLTQINLTQNLEIAFWTSLMMFLHLFLLFCLHFFSLLFSVEEWKIKTLF